MFIPVEERNKSNLLYRRLRAIKDSMMGRCYTLHTVPEVYVWMRNGIS